jgi:hypothetical protein
MVVSASLCVSLDDEWHEIAAKKGDERQEVEPHTDFNYSH